MRTRAKRSISPPESTSSTLSCITVQTSDSAPRSSMGASSSSHTTPPTSQEDDTSVSGDATKLENPAEAPETHAQVTAPLDPQSAKSEDPSTTNSMESSMGQDMEQSSTDHAPSEQNTEQQTGEQTSAEENTQSGRRSARNSRKSVATYNVQILAGTAIHTPTKYLEIHHKNVYRDGEIPEVPPPQEKTGRADGEDNDEAAEDQLQQEAGQRPSQKRKSSHMNLLKEATHNLGKKSRYAFDSGKERLQALKGTPSGSSRAMSKASTPASLRGSRLFGSLLQNLGDDGDDQSREFTMPKFKAWEEQGLYVGQHREFDARFTESTNKSRRKSTKKPKERKYLPMPLFAGERLLTEPNVRDFQLPFDVFSPLPRKVDPKNWTKIYKNRFVGEASALWKRERQLHDSKCQCTPEEGCGDQCYNRVMSYECDDSNCPLTRELCGNRPFADLKARAKGNNYDYGVEVVSTEDRGFGVRAMRTFRPNQIIVEYAGEIITQDESERRMRSEYKKNECFYLMYFDHKMIIDATKGTIARFVNHSCEPNCRMEKLIVAGEPRMALFAGNRGIMTGEELTYDYKFDPYSRKNIQECRCGAPTCRGIISGKAQDQAKQALAAVKSVAKNLKRKAEEVISGKASDNTPSSPNKRRKMASIVGSALSKVQKSLTESEPAKDDTPKEDVGEAPARKASRAERALRRSASLTALSSQQSKTVSKSASGSLKTTISKRINMGIARRASTPAPTQLKEPTGKLSRISSAIKKRSAAAATRGRKSLPALSSLRNKTVEDAIGSPQSSTTSGSSGLRQSTLPFKPLSLDITSSPLASDPMTPITSPDDTDMPDADVQEFAGLSPRSNKRPGTATSIRNTVGRSVRSTRRAAAVARTGFGIGFNGKDALNRGVTQSTIRMISGDDE